MAKKLNAIETASVLIAKNVKAVGVEIHNHLVVIMTDIVKNRNTGNAAHFLTLLVANDKEGNSKSVVRADAVKNWLEAFAFVRFGNKDGKLTDKLNGKALDSLVDPKEMAAHVRTAKSNPWYNYTTAKPVVPFDIIEAIKSAVKRAEDRETKVAAGEIVLPAGKVDNIPHDFLDALKALVADK